MNLNRVIALTVSMMIMLTSSGAVYADDDVSSSCDNEIAISEADKLKQNADDFALYISDSEGVVSESKSVGADDEVSENCIQNDDTITGSMIPEGTEEVDLAENETTGTCGDNLTWYFDESNTTLMISGSGAMDNNNSPWNDFSEQITTIIIEEGVTTIGNYAFRGCSALSNVDIPESVTSIGENAFSGCSNLQSIELPENLKSIGSWAFHFCSGLVSIYIPDSVKQLNQYAFEGCSSLISVELPIGLTSINSGEFCNCSSLASIELPSGVTGIKNGAFFGCHNLSSISIPQSVTTISNDAFNYCESLTDVYYEGTEEQWNDINVAFDNEMLTTASFHFSTVPTPGLKIFSQPKSAVALLKTKVCFAIMAKNVESYQWQYSKDNGLTWTNLNDSATTSSYIGGATTNRLTIMTTITRCGYIYRCQIIGINGEVINSDAASLTRNTTLTITTQPKDTVGSLMKRTTFKVTAVNAVSYQWQYSKNNGTTWNTLKDSETSSTYLGGTTTNAVTMLMNASRSSFLYRCKITGEDGDIAYTDVVKVLLFVISTQPQSVQAKSGDTVTLSVGAEYAASYQWYYQKEGNTSWYKLTDNAKASMLISGSTADTMTIKMTKTRMTYKYRCKVKGQDGTSKYTDVVEVLS